jgi:hypothetical protein
LLLPGGLLMLAVVGFGYEPANLIALYFGTFVSIQYWRGLPLASQAPLNLVNVQ